MAEFIAVTSKGMADVLADELVGLGLKVLKKGPAGVTFDSNWEGCYRANLELRTATRIIKPVLDFPAYKPDELYNNIMKHDFTKYLGLNDTFMIDASVRDSSFHDQRFVAMKIKDAIADQFREKYGERPNVDNKEPDVMFMVRIVKNQVSVSVDTTGDNLSHRGYRSEQGEAPLREHLAAGLVKMTGWECDTALVDPMCGSGTILIEAALMLKNITPGSLRKKFAFQKFADFKSDVWDRLVTEALDREQAVPNVHLYGYDRDSKVVRMARRNAERAGVDDLITFEQSGVDMLARPVEKGMMILNPPYGERLGVTEELKDSYKDLAYGLKKEFKGWTCWILSGNEDLTKALKLKSSRRIPLFNGAIECRFLEYKIN
ncbi:MAG: RNA methyltransferase [Bdellovibrionales bacterium]|nr:RNA methyltransferase [Bdellovibrionales bacterium]